MADETDERFFVTIRCGTLEGLAAVRALGLDLFGTTAKADKDVTIEGLLTLADIGRVVRNGYEVVVHEDAASRSRAHEQAESAEQWLAEMGA
jgi:putative N-acetylmannosamine-6-phosphate epimerase